MNDTPQLPPQFDLIRLDRVDSVMLEGVRRARDGADEGTVVWALEQIDARTRHGHHWFSPPGNLYCSLVLRPEYSNGQCGQLAYVAALGAGSALADQLSPMTGLRYRWPTDLLINDLRAGQVVLASSGSGKDPYEWLVLGVMINVALHPPNPEPEEFVSVHASGAPDVTVTELFEAFTRYFLHWINRWAEDGFAPIARQWQIRADGLGEEIDLHVGERRLRGTFVEIDEAGRLILSVPGEGERRISVNEYFALDNQ